MKKIIFALIAFMSFGQLISQAPPNKEVKKDSLYNFNHHENLSKMRYEKLQTKIDEYVANGDTNGLRFLSAQLDAQLKLEDFLIRFREAEHAKFTFYNAAFLTAIVSIVTTLLTLFITRYPRKLSPNVAAKVP